MLRAADGSLSSLVFEGAAELLAQEPRPAVLAIDVPIGATESGPRRCDVEARALLGRRASTVFTAPVRPVLAAASWDEACAIRERIEGRRMSRQAWGIVPKVAEVDRALRRNPGRDGWIREVHPEVSFATWNGSPMRHRKKGIEGRTERMELVASYFGSPAFAGVRARHRAGDVAAADILDAFAALWTAERIARGEAATLPAEPPTDRFGLRMEIVY